MTLLAVFSALIARTSGQDELTVGTPVEGRLRPEVEDLVGFFVNTLPLPISVAGDPSFDELLGRVRETTMEAYEHQELPFERLVEALDPVRDLSRSPLFQVMFILQSGEHRLRPSADLLAGLGAGGALPSADLAVEGVAPSTGISKFDLTLNLFDQDAGFVGQWAYSADLFDRSTVARATRHLETLAEAAVAAPTTPVSHLALLSAGERQQLLVEWNEPLVAHAATGFVHEMVTEVARRVPDRVALVSGDGERTSYRALTTESAGIAERLRAHGVGPGRIVGVYAERSARMVATLLGVLSAGGAYLPLDPNLPEERLRFMAEDAGLGLILADAARGERARELFGGSGDVDVLPLDAPRPAKAVAGGAGGRGPAAALQEDHPAYVLYTSGSTGRPKGVVVPHRALGNRIEYARTKDVSSEDAFLQKTTISFDVSIAEIFGPLVAGGRSVLPPPGAEKDTGYLVDLVARERVTQTSFPPTLLYALLEEERFRSLESLRVVITGGETVPPELPERFYSHLGDAVLLNRYGPTEATISVTSWPCARSAPERSLPIGRPTANARIVVVDATLRPVPLGASGELLLGGPSLARGYLQRPARTAESFVPDPFASRDGGRSGPGARLYRTGDLVRLRPDGALEFVGRIDNQVKIRGYRVELGEIEAALARQPGVREVAVVDRGGGADRKVVAYLVAEDGERLDPEGLAMAVAASLPPYMVPSAFVTLEALPLTPTGKVDRKALPEPEEGTEGPAEGGGGAGEAPRGPVEELVAAVWGEVLGVEAAHRDDDFFDLGGHSLLATRVVSRLRRRFGIELPLRVLFESPTIRGLAAAIDAGRRSRETPPIPRRPRSRGPGTGATELPLSFAQERLWFLDRMDAESAAYNLLAAIRLEGRLDPAALRRSLAELVARHETLRTVFATVDGEPVQRVLPAGPPVVAEIDLTLVPAARREALADELARRDASRRFDLATGPLLRATLVRMAPEDHLFLASMHHIVSDGWSLGVFVRELSALYAAFASGRAEPSPPALAPLPIQYGDFAAWQREWLTGDVLEAQLDYWRERLAGASSVLDLPTDRPRPPIQSFRGATVGLAVPADVTARLQALARSHGATLFMVCMAGFQGLLARSTGQGELTVGTTIANRNRPEVEGLIGFFVNVLALRGELGDDPTFAEMLDRVRAESLGAHDHQDLPFEKLVQEIHPDRDLSRSPLFQVLMQLQNAPMGSLELGDLTVRPVMRDTATAKFDLILNLVERGGALHGQWRYKTDLFDRTTIRRMGRHLVRLLDAASRAPERRLSELSLLDAAERHQVVHELAGDGARFPAGETLDAAFLRQAAARPDAVAVACGGSALTYGALAARAGAVAAALVELGVAPGAPVGLCVERSVDMVVAILGVLRAGAAYLPLDPAYPEDRLAFMVEDSGASVIVADGSAEGIATEIASGSSAATVRVLALDRVLDRAVDRAPGAGSAPPASRTAPGAPAYVIYTSGSTGRPKGVPVPHANALRLFAATDAWFGFGSDDAWTLFHSYAFDFSVWELWGALLYGGRLVVVPHEVSRDPDAFRGLLAEERVTSLSQTPSAFRQLVRADRARPEPLDALRTVVFGGEALELSSLAPWVERYGDRRPELVNMYGITETTVHVTYRRIRAADLAAGRGSVIGRPIPDLCLSLLDRGGRPVPLGVAGEIHVGGAGLALGYAGRPALTAERFVPAPVTDPAATAGARLYRSGDLARWLPDGDLEYLGRIDHQVKVRGFRIELGEIESALAAHPAVAEAVVLARRASGETSEDELRLVAYVVPAGDELPSVADLRAFVGESLPDYMVPAAVVSLEAIPLTANGKVDRRALPEPGSLRPALGGEYVAPRDPLETYLAELWRGGLGVDRVGAFDDFFDLGGNSLVGAVLINRLQEALGEIVHVVVMFDCPTVASLAGYLRSQHPAGVGRLLGAEAALGLGPGAGSGTGAGAAAEQGRPAPPVEAPMLATVRELIAGMDRFTVRGAREDGLNRPALFVLSPPRSGSTLLRVMLGGHPRLFAPPELELLSFDTMADRARAFTGRDAFWKEGLLRAVMEADGCDVEEARRLVAEAEAEGWTTQRVYRLLQERIGERLLVDKSPSYSLHPGVLARAEEQFDGARYLHLVRHPYGMIRSFEEAKLDQIFFPAEHGFARRRLAEMLWTVSHETILTFLAGVPEERRLEVHFEALVREPERELRRVCELPRHRLRPGHGPSLRGVRGAHDRRHPRAVADARRRQVPPARRHRSGGRRPLARELPAGLPRPAHLADGRAARPGGPAHRARTPRRGGGRRTERRRRAAAVARRAQAWRRAAAAVPHPPGLRRRPLLPRPGPRPRPGPVGLRLPGAGDRGGGGAPGDDRGDGGALCRLAARLRPRRPLPAGRQLHGRQHRLRDGPPARRPGPGAGLRGPDRHPGARAASRALPRRPGGGDRAQLPDARAPVGLPRRARAPDTGRAVGADARHRRAGGPAARGGGPGHPGPPGPGDHRQPVRGDRLPAAALLRPRHLLPRRGRGRALHRAAGDALAGSGRRRARGPRGPGHAPLHEPATPRQPPRRGPPAGPRPHPGGDPFDLHGRNPRLIGRAGPPAPRVLVSRRPRGGRGDTGWGADGAIRQSGDQKKCRAPEKGTRPLNSDAPRSAHRSCVSTLSRLR